MSDRTATDPLARFLEIIDVANDHDIERELLTDVLQRLERFGFASHTVARTFSADRSALVPAARVTVDPTEAQRYLDTVVVPVKGSFEGLAITENRIVLIEETAIPEIDFDPGYLGICLQALDHGVVSAYMFPLVASEPIGTLTFYGFKDQEFDERSLQLAHRAARVLASGIEKCRMLADAEQKRAELERANALFEASNRDLEDFAYVASHDLQEPLRKIQTFGDRLETKAADRLTEQQRSYLHRMSGASEQIQALINDLLRYSRANTRGGDPVPIELSDVVTAAMAGCAGPISAFGVEIDVGALPTVLADHELMVELFELLIAKSIKYARADVPTTITIETDRRAGRPDPEMVTIIYRDNGIGFDPKYDDRIFQPFYRLHAQDDVGGSGIGLAVCRRILTRYDGEISAHGTPGSGTVFTLQFRVQPPVQSDASAS